MTDPTRRNVLRRRALGGLYRTLMATLRERVHRASDSAGQARPPDNSTGFIRIARAEAPGLLEQITALRKRLFGR